MVKQQSYRAVQATRPGVLEIVEWLVVKPDAGGVRVRVEACGVCHSDRWTVEGNIVPIDYPRVPGHEVVSRIDALGEGVRKWKLGQRVGVGFLAGRCGKCLACRRGHFTRCANQTWTGIHHDGGCANVALYYPPQLRR
jgi:propanol-preferring alcohol dehydrogenase